MSDITDDDIVALIEMLEGSEAAALVTVDEDGGFSSNLLTPRETITVSQWVQLLGTLDLAKKEIGEILLEGSALERQGVEFTDIDIE